MSMTRRSNPRWRIRHQSVLEFLLRHPAAKREACALATGYSPWQVSRIVNSPSFRDRLEQAFRYRLMEVARLRVGGKR
jgi:hypothetical protein